MKKERICVWSWVFFSLWATLIQTFVVSCQAGEWAPWCFLCNIAWVYFWPGKEQGCSAQLLMWDSSSFSFSSSKQPPLLSKPTLLVPSLCLNLMGEFSGQIPQTGALLSFRVKLFLSQGLKTPISLCLWDYFNA